MSQERQLYRFLVRGGEAAAISALNEIPLERELIVETDTLKFKIGDGVTRYLSLPYLGATRDQISMGAGDRINPVPVGTKALVPVTYDCRISRYMLLLVTSDGLPGSIAVDVRRTSFNAFGPGMPTAANSVSGGTFGISGGIKLAAAAAGWASNIQRNDILVLHIESRSENVTHVALALETEKSR